MSLDMARKRSIIAPADIIARLTSGELCPARKQKGELGGFAVLVTPCTRPKGHAGKHNNRLIRGREPIQEWQ